VSDERLKIAVFIDFDNIEIGVKTTLGGQFDVGAVLEAVKERGEVVSKVAYGDWTRATDYGRSMSQHAIHMVQRNLTPGGDKNGADINLALDALEMAFTHNHINAFVIVGGDSDFITLVEKLKQYDRKVFVVGGRSFTSQVMQKNCTEFVAYEDILGITGRARHGAARARPLSDIATAMPLVRRAIKLLADREMTPQLGLLKSTLLQLDSSFSERAYGSSSFRDFVEKLAKAGYVALKGADRSIHVELLDTGEGAVAATAPGAHRDVRPRREQREPHHRHEGRDGGHGGNGQPQAAAADAMAAEAAEAQAETLPHEPAAGEPAPEERGDADEAPRLGPADGYRIMTQAFSRPDANPRFPMYVRQFKQFIKGFDEGFDERRYGFAGILDALRFAQREGLVRLDRDRRGGVRVHAGPQYLEMTKAFGASPVEPPTDERAPAGATSPEVPPEAFEVASRPLDGERAPEPAPEPVPVEAVADAAPPVEEEQAAAPAVATEDRVDGPAVEPPRPAPRAPARRRAGARAGTSAKKTSTPAPPAKKRPARPRAKKAPAGS
jgi:uncharacterized LabA/DUF88 family protein